MEVLDNTPQTPDVRQGSGVIIIFWRNNKTRKWFWRMAAANRIHLIRRVGPFSSKARCFENIERVQRMIGSAEIMNEQDYYVRGERPTKKLKIVSWKEMADA